MNRKLKTRRQFVLSSAGLSLSLTATHLVQAQTGATAPGTADRTGLAISQTDETVAMDKLGHKLSVRVRWPHLNFGAARPLVIFSHGLGGTLEAGRVFAQAWAQAGIVVVNVLHSGSDMHALRQSARQAMAPEQLVNRVNEVRGLIDFLHQAKANAADSPWKRIDLDRTGIAGHSFGSRTAMALAGEHFPNGPASLDLSEPRAKAFLCLSPLSSKGNMEAMRVNLSKVTRPMLCATGSNDGDVANQGTTPAMRRDVFEALPKGQKALIWLKEADHFTFAGQVLPASVLRIRREDLTVTLQAEHLQQVSQISTDWWLKYLALDPQAEHNLFRPRLSYERGDEWLRE